MDILIKNALVLSMEPGEDIRRADVGISDEKIAFVGKNGGFIPGRVIDGTDRLVMPGLVNAHTHVAMSLLRGYADDYPLHTWLNDHVLPAEAKLTERDVYSGALLGMAEMIRTGTISITDMYFKIPMVAKAAYEAGIYANIGNGATSFDKDNFSFEKDNSYKESMVMLSDWHGCDSGRIMLDASIHAEYTSFDTLWHSVADFAAKHKLRMHVHVSETQKEVEECIHRYEKTPVEVFESHGILDFPVTAAHCVHLRDNDFDILRKKNVSIAHNPVSNLKLGSGIAPVADMKNINVALGTDGVCSNNSFDMFEELKYAALLQKGVRHDPTLIPAYTALEMATVNGAKSQGREKNIGKISPGYDASLIMLDLSGANMFPRHNLLSNAVYSASGADVRLTMVRGKILYENGEYKTIDLEKIKSEIK